MISYLMPSLIPPHIFGGSHKPSPPNIPFPTHHCIPAPNYTRHDLLKHSYACQKTQLAHDYLNKIQEIVYTSICLQFVSMFQMFLQKRC